MGYICENERAHVCMLVSQWVFLLGKEKSKWECHSKPPVVPAFAVSEASLCLAPWGCCGTGRSLARVENPGVSPSLLNTFTVHEGWATVVMMHVHVPSCLLCLWDEMTFQLTELSSPQEMCHLMVEAFWSYFSGNQKVSRACGKQHSAVLDKSQEPGWLLRALPLSLRLFLICEMGVMSPTYLDRVTVRIKSHDYVGPYMWPTLYSFQVISTSILSSDPLNNSAKYFDPHFTDEETKAQNREVTWPKPHS